MGNTSIQQFCNNPASGDQTGPLTISFSSDLSSVSFNFATVGGDSTLTAEALENGNPVSTSTFNSGIPPGQLADEGFASITGTFNMLVLTGGGGALLAIDNINTPAVPEPGGVALLGAACRLWHSSSPTHGWPARICTKRSRIADVCSLAQSDDQRLNLPHEAIHRVEQLAKITIAVKVDLERAHSRCFPVAY